MFRKLLTRLALLGLATSALAQPVPPEDEAAFTRQAAETLQRSLSSGTVTVQGPLTLRVGDSRINLDRIHDFCRRDRANCADHLNAFLQDMAVSLRERDDKPKADALRIVLRPAAYVAAARATLARGNAANSLDARPFFGGLLAVPVLDGERSVKLLGSQQRDELGLADDEAFARGLKNLRDRLPPLAVEAPPLPPGRLGTMSPDYYQPSRLLLHDDWAGLAAAQGGVLVVAVPTTDRLLYSADDSPAALAALQVLVGETMARAPNPLSPQLLRWRHEGWELIPAP
ncbi:hypothetical protein [Rubrivivax gelatinosus]|uniref:DUF1444 family protein n=1 Tax=Rubrivivax gelatinosus (strain NBRC 100245 / IL144) TaxID=983917 RepID=I0HTM2_RUBGI|nr:hypothetical protein [Rubrivivax gelatinosus]BAL96359.1 hypothetical protein RGE_30200 [Rubrivivax gelatinosus IL144]